MKNQIIVQEQIIIIINEFRFNGITLFPKKWCEIFRGQLQLFLNYSYKQIEKLK